MTKATDHPPKILSANGVNRQDFISRLNGCLGSETGQSFITYFCTWRQLGLGMSLR
ncbi:MAG: hypothetical protein ABSD50_02545 [Smithella sp.]